jgi:Vitamin K-dependent gamma-carboxylase
MQIPLTESRLSRSYTSWTRFWFTPSDPTVLAAIRILVGAIALYTLIGYSFDLQEFVGEHAWLDLELRQEQYRDFPVVIVPFDWLGSNYGPPTTAEEKQYYLEYLRRWGEPPPLPYPKTAQEAKAYDEYRARWNVDPRSILTKGQPVWSVWFHVTDPFWMNVVQGSFLLCSFLFLIGCATRVTSVLTWFAVLSFVHRDPTSLFGADTMMVVLLMYLMIGPSGAALSIDRLLACWWARSRGLPEPEISPSVSANLALRLIQIHACIIYASAGLAKLQGQSWWYGTAPWGTLANFEFAPMQYPFYVGLLRFLAKTRWIYELTMTIGALGTLTFEIGYPFLIWRPGFRTLWLWMAVLLHAGIGMFLGLRTFSFLMLAFNLAFVSPQTVRWVLAKLAPKAWSPEDKETRRHGEKGQQAAAS